jgi:hypothetical protein
VGLAPITNKAASVGGVEVRPTDDWVAWQEIASAVPAVTVTGTKFSIGSGFGGEKEVTLTGRVEVASGGPYNVIVLATVEGSNGFLALTTDVDCINSGKRYAFEATTFAVLPKSPKLGKVWAVTTTVPGVGTDVPPGC